MEVNDQGLRPERDGGATAFVPVEVEGQTVYLSVHDLGAARSKLGYESDVAARRPSLDEALSSLMGMARGIGARLQESDASKVSVQFGCEFALETGGLVAVVGKASSKSTFTVGLEWERRTG